MIELAVGQLWSLGGSLPYKIMEICDHTVTLYSEVTNDEYSYPRKKLGTGDWKLIQSIQIEEGELFS